MALTSLQLRINLILIKTTDLSLINLILIKIADCLIPCWLREHALGYHGNQRLY